MVAPPQQERFRISSSTAPFEWRASAGRWRWLILGALGAAPNACGGRADAVGTDSSGADPQGPVPPGGTSPQPESHTSASGCAGAVALGGGWQRCENGLIHRPIAGACTSIVPRPEPTVVPSGYEISEAHLQCREDGDCRDAPHGHCEWSAGDVFGSYCEYGCTVDSDCSGGQVCLCGAAVGACVSARCSTDADCEGGLLCADYIENPGCGGTAFACQTPADECSAQSDCQEEGYCALDDNGLGARRVCTTALCTVGRPFLVDGNERLAPPLGRSDWYTTPSAAEARHPSLDAALRAELARSWAQQGLMEHASVAAFARFTLQLLSLGAPASLVQRSSEAMQDEIRHARACFELARDYAEADVGPGPLLLDGALAESDVASVVLGTLLEGCIGETVAALEAAEALAHCEDGKTRAVLERISAEEGQHAELAWSFVEWALATGPQELQAQVRSAFEAALAGERSAHRPPTALERQLLRHGVVGPELRQALRERVLDEVIAPCARALLTRPRVANGRLMASARHSWSRTAG